MREGKAPRAPHSAGRVDSNRLSAGRRRARSGSGAGEMSGHVYKWAGEAAQAGASKPTCQVEFGEVAESWVAPPGGGQGAGDAVAYTQGREGPAQPSLGMLCVQRCAAGSR